MTDCPQVDGNFIPPELAREQDSIDRFVLGATDFAAGFGTSAQGLADSAFDIATSPFLAQSRSSLYDSAAGMLYAARHPWATAKAIAADCSAARMRCAGSLTFGAVSSLVGGGGAAKAGGISRTRGRSPSKPGRSLDIHPRVRGQLDDPRLGVLRGKLSEAEIQDLAHNPTATYLMDYSTGNINVVQEVEGVLLRITVPRDALKIISVGRLRPNQLRNGLENGRFGDIGSGG